MSSCTISPIDNTPMYSAFKAIISDLKSSINIQSGLQQLVMMRFNLSMAKESGLMNILMNIPITDDLESLKNIVIGKIECMEYVEVKKKMMEDYAAGCSEVKKTKKRPATSGLEPVAKRLCPAPVKECPVLKTSPPAQPVKKIDNDFFCRKRTLPVKFVRKPKAPATTAPVPVSTVTTTTTSRPQSSSTSLELMKKCRDIRQAKEAKEKIVAQKKVESTKSVLETYREQRIKEQQNRNNGIVPKIDMKKVNRKYL